jgi:Predicted membrane protein (DUF2232)
MPTPGSASRWRLVLGVIAFALWAPLALVGLPTAALLAVAPDRSLRPRIAAALLGATSIALLALPGGRLSAVIGAYTVLVTAAFVTGAALDPIPFLRQALRAVCIGGVGIALLVQLVWGAGGWGALAWDATREAGLTMQLFVAFLPNTFTLYEPVVRFVSTTTPGMLALQALAGLALAWQWHGQLTVEPLGPPLAPFREFRISDAWVWGVVGWLAILVAPVSGVLKVAGTNVGFVLGTLYVLRGAAIMVSFAQALGVSAAALVIFATAAATIALPVFLPGLCTLGITDTWYQFRRRLAARRPNAT